MSDRIRFLPLLLGIPLLSLAGCPQTPLNNPPTSAGKLVRFQSADEMLRFFRERVNEQRDVGFFERFGLPGAQPLAADFATGGNEAAGDDGGGRTFTSTNLQEAGVDEADVVKTDGEYFYIARGNSLQIVRAAPVDQLGVVASLTLDVYASEMYLRGDTLIVLAQHYTQSDRWGLPGEDIAVEIWPPYYMDAEAVLVAIDITDRTAPVEIARTELDGAVVNSRLVNDRVILVLSHTPPVLEGASRAEVASVTLDEVLPQVRTSQGAAPLVAWDDSYRPENPIGYRMTTVATLNADDITEVLDATAVVADAGTIYSSRNALYVTDPQYWIGGTERESTTIHQFDFDDDGVARYVASGDVPGRLLNQFSLSEHDGYLRVATHIQRFDLFPVFVGGGAVGGAADEPANAPDVAPPPGRAQAADVLESDYNALYVLKPNGDELQIVGQIEGIEPDERIYAARFMGERGFLVTFRIIDPLLAFDLSDPANPQLVGELKLPGYADYLHPIGETHLLGVGRSVTNTDFGGVFPDAAQLALFDVSDLANPQLVERLEIGGQGSYAHVSQTHKAFAYEPSTRTLALPVVLFDAPGTAVGFDLDQFVGTICYEVDPANGFTRIGRVPAASGSAGVDTLWWFGWLRSAIIDDQVYTISPEGVSVAPRGDLDDIAQTPLN